MDNQHITEIGLAYLAGAIDGEGTITLERAGKRRLNGEMGVTPMICISNTNDFFINRCQQILDSISISSYIKTQQRGQWKTCYWIIVKGMVKVQKLCRLIDPYLVAKTGQLNLVLRWIDSRLDGEVNPKAKPYSNEELGMIDKIRALNK